MLVVVQVSTVVVGGEILTDGALLFCVITCAAVAVHPFAAVTVTVYVPELVTLNVAFVPTTEVPLDHEYVPPPVAVNEILGVIQVTMVVLGAEMAVVGTAIF